jgi:hypothetical protein
MRLVQGVDERQANLLEAQFKLGQYRMAKCFSGNAGAIGNEENGAVGWRKEMGREFWHDLF